MATRLADWPKITIFTGQLMFGMAVLTLYRPVSDTFSRLSGGVKKSLFKTAVCSVKRPLAASTLPSARTGMVKIGPKMRIPCHANGPVATLRLYI